MAYTPNEWGVGNLITASKMNKIERQLVANTSDLDDIRNGVTVPTYDEFETLRDDVAAEYDNTKTYAVGDYVIYNTQLYKCKTAITSAETWTATHWDAVEVGEELQRIEAASEEDVTSLKSQIGSELDFFALEQGSYNVGNGNPLAVSKYVRSTTKIVDKTHINTESLPVYISGVFIYNDDGSFDEYINPEQMQTDIDINPGNGKYALFSLKSRDNSDITPGDIQPNLTMTNLLNAAKEVPLNTEALMDTMDLTGALTSGYGVNTSKSIGTVIDDTPVANNALAYAIIPCKYKDKFTITGKGGATYRLWCFTDENYRLKSSSAANATADNLELTALCDGYFIANVLIAEIYSLKAFQRIGLRWTAKETKRLSKSFPEYTHITNPHYLFWRMGAFDANGAQGFSSGMLRKDRFFTIVKVKAGSTVTKKAITRARNLAFGYKLYESDTTLSGYTSNAGDSITIEQDCIAYIGIRYSNPVADLLDDTILDTFDFNLKVIDYKSRYARGDGTIDTFIPNGTIVYPRNYGWPCPEIYYEGQHTDNTGWTNSFSDIAAIYAAFDTLATNSNKYLSRTRDYGVAYIGNADNPNYSADSEWHLYEYTTKPATGNNTVPKVAITCCMHGNEKMSAYAMHYLMYDLIYNGTKNPALAWIKSNLIITFIPICNPYGFMKAIPSRVNENQVNLNRNFPTYNWADYETGEGTLNYKGTAPASETETQMMMWFYRNHYDAVLAIDLHTNGADTAMRDQISAYMPALAQSESDKDYDILDSFITPGKNYTTRLKQWLNDKYNANMSYDYAYGTSIPISYYPCAPHWVRETAGLVGQCYEVMAGSSTGVMGDELTVYAPATIKAAAEELGNVLVAIINHCKGL